MQLSKDTFLEDLIARYRDRTAVVAVIGLGYVGLPLANALTMAGFKVVGLDIDPEKISLLQSGQSYIRHLPGAMFTKAIDQGRFDPTTEFERIADADAVLI